MKLSTEDTHQTNALIHPLSTSSRAACDTDEDILVLTVNEKENSQEESVKRNLQHSSREASNFQTKIPSQNDKNTIADKYLEENATRDIKTSSSEEITMPGAQLSVYRAVGKDSKDTAEESTETKKKENDIEELEITKEANNQECLREGQQPTDFSESSGIWEYISRDYDSMSYSGTCSPSQEPISSSKRWRNVYVHVSQFVLSIEVTKLFI